jgi:hypothetical protein
MKSKKSHFRLPAGLIGCIALLSIFIFVYPALNDRQQTSALKPVAPVPVVKQMSAPAATPTSQGRALLRPLPVSLRKGFHEWTAADGKDSKVIEKIAHNPEEFIRLNEENERIKRRQLVYRKITVPMLLDRARDSGEPLRSFMLPGLDGMEIEIEVTGTQLNQVGNGGSVTGRVKGRFNSMVSVGFANGCESFNVLSPDEGLFLTADAREPGEVMVKEIDPNQYNPPAGATPDFILADDHSSDQKTNQKPK